jgi:hypothetical protein
MTSTAIEIKRKHIGALTVIVCQIEETFMGNYSVLVHNEEGHDVWIERFAPTFAKAQEIGEKIFAKVCKQY